MDYRKPLSWELGRFSYFKKLLLAFKQGDESDNKHSKTQKFSKCYVHFHHPLIYDKEHPVHRDSGNSYYNYIKYRQHYNLQLN